tara:strand:+ start:1391 stop:2338 length:948 start_codon:yes stop_codon:yes gene_type:complete
MIRILFTNSGRRTYLLNYCHKLTTKGYKIKIYASDTSYDVSSFYTNRHVKNFITPQVSDNEKSYLSKLFIICKKNKIDLLIPLIDPELKILSKNKDKFLKIGTNIVVSDYELVSKLIDKKKVDLFCRKNQIKYPKSYYNLRSFNNKFPVIKKKIIGSASVGLEIIKNKKKFKNINFKKNMLQKFIKGKEINLDILNDFAGNYVHSCAKLKISMRGGETDKAKILNQSKYTLLSKKISKTLKHIGPMDIDLIEDNSGNFYFIDFNPRFGGGYEFTRAAGCDYLKAIIDMHLNKKTTLPSKPKPITGMKGIQMYYHN